MYLFLNLRNSFSVITKIFVNYLFSLIESAGELGNIASLTQLVNHCGLFPDMRVGDKRSVLFCDLRAFRLQLNE